MRKARALRLRFSQSLASRRQRFSEAIRAEANVLIVQTMINRMTEIVLSGFYLDSIVRCDGRLLFKERLCIYDSLLLPTSLVAPV